MIVLKRLKWYGIFIGLFFLVAALIVFFGGGEKTETISGTYYGTTTGNYQNRMEFDDDTILYDYGNSTHILISMNLTYKVEGKKITFYYGNKKIG